MSREAEFRAIRNKTQALVDCDVQRKNDGPKNRFNVDLINKGSEWYSSGLALEDAPEHLKNNTNFINGYLREQRLQDVNDDFYARGMEAFFHDTPWVALSEQDRENEAFLQGYEDAMTMQVHKHK